MTICHQRMRVSRVSLRPQSPRSYRLATRRNAERPGMSALLPRCPYFGSHVAAARTRPAAVFGTPPQHGGMQHVHWTDQALFRKWRAFSRGCLNLWSTRSTKFSVQPQLLGYGGCSLFLPPRVPVPARGRRARTRRGPDRPCRAAGQVRRGCHPQTAPPLTTEAQHASRPTRPTPIPNAQAQQETVAPAASARWQQREIAAAGWPPASPNVHIDRAPTSGTRRRGGVSSR